MEPKNKCIICFKKGRTVVRNNLSMFLCDSCNLFWREDFSLPENHYENQDFRLSNEKIEQRVSNAKDRINIIKKYVTLDNLCDIGCGEGVFLKTLKDLGYKNLVGLEPGKVAQDFAKTNNLKIVEGSIESLDRKFFSENNIHTVTMFHVIEHLNDPFKLLKKVFDSMSVGDKLVIETPDMESYLLKKLNYVHELIYPEHFYYFNKKNIKKILKNIGFKIVVSGNRDFDPKNMSIRESLMRLGLLRPMGRVVGKSDTTSMTGKIKEIKDNPIKTIIRSILSKAVTFFDRGSYLWLVAEK